MQSAYIRAMGSVFALAALISAGSGTWTMASAQEQSPVSAALRMETWT